MYKLLFIALHLTVLNTSSFAQTIDSRKYEYFIRISGIDSREDVEFLESSISKKNAVISFMANRYPVRYFLMKSDKVISKSDFELFLRNSSFRIEFYGIGEKGREEAILIYNKIKAPQ